MKSKQHERIDLLITAIVNIYETRKNIPIVIFAFLKENWWNSLEPPPFQLTPYFWAIFSWPPSLSKFQKQELKLGGEETMYS